MGPLTGPELPFRKIPQCEGARTAPWPPKQQGLTHGFEKGDDVIASSLSGENFFAC